MYCPLSSKGLETIKWGITLFTCFWESMLFLLFCYFYQKDCWVMSWPWFEGERERTLNFHVSSVGYFIFPIVRVIILLWKRKILTFLLLLSEGLLGYVMAMVWRRKGESFQLSIFHLSLSACYNSSLKKKDSFLYSIGTTPFSTFSACLEKVVCCLQCLLFVFQ